MDLRIADAAARVAQQIDDPARFHVKTTEAPTVLAVHHLVPIGIPVPEVRIPMTVVPRRPHREDDLLDVGEQSVRLLPTRPLGTIRAGRQRC